MRGKQRYTAQSRDGTASSEFLKKECLNVLLVRDLYSVTCSCEVESDSYWPQEDSIENPNDREEKRNLVEVHLANHFLEHHFVDGTACS